MGKGASMAEIGCIYATINIYMNNKQWENVVDVGLLVFCVWAIIRYLSPYFGFGFNFYAYASLLVFGAALLGFIVFLLKFHFTKINPHPSISNEFVLGYLALYVVYLVCYVSFSFFPEIFNILANSPGGQITLIIYRYLFLVISVIGCVLTFKYWQQKLHTQK
jgi:hypothetical protein